MGRDKILSGLAIVVGLLTFAVVLAFYRTVDGDLWARLAAGAAFFHGHDVMRHDVFAFTPTLPAWVDHEWGAGVIFFALLKWFGPAALMVFKIVVACLALLAGLAAARLNGARTPVILLIAIPCAVTILPGYANVVRSHTLSFLFFGGLLLALELIRQGKRWPAFLIVPMMLVWVNVHGGFVVGLGTIGVYALLVGPARKTLLLTLLACLAVTCVNPYGFDFWKYLVPALLHPRSDISEWAPMPLWGSWHADPYIGFRFLFVLAVVIVIAGRKHGSWLGVAMLLITAVATLRSRRHAPFFGLAAAAYLAPYLDGLLHRKIKWEMPVLGVYAALAAFVAVRFLPAATMHPQAPEGFYPVHTVDILAASQAQGNLAVPFRWGSYASWRLFPRVRVSVDGRYEETYPDATFEMNHDLFHKNDTRGNWDRLLRDYHVDFILIETQVTGVTLDDWRQRSYDIIWSDAASALLARRELVPALREIEAHLPERTTEPLDPAIPEAWWR